MHVHQTYCGVDDDINVRRDPSRDTPLLDNTPIDYPDFASPTSGPEKTSANGVARSVWTRKPPQKWTRFGTLLELQIPPSP